MCAERNARGVDALLHAINTLGEPPTQIAEEVAAAIDERCGCETDR